MIETATIPFDTFLLELSKNDTTFFFSEEELDEEIRLSMRSGNATQEEVDAVLNRGNIQ